MDNKDFIKEVINLVKELSSYIDVEGSTYEICDEHYDVFYDFLGENNLKYDDYFNLFKSEYVKEISLIYLRKKLTKNKSLLHK